MKDNRPRPTSWPGRKRDRRALLLSEISIVRRVKQGESVAVIASALGMTPVGVRQALQRMREEFGVADNEALVAHPDVVRQVSSS